jgi:hypothetical protein
MIKGLIGLKGFSAWSVYNKVVFNLIFNREFNEDKHTFLNNVAELVAETDIVTIRENLPDLAITSKRVHKTAKHCILDFKSRDRAKRAEMLTEAITFSNLDDDEVLRLIAVHVDSNGMPYSKVNVSNLNIGELFNMMINTMLDCSELDCDLSLMSQDNKSVLGNGRVNIKEQVAEILENNGDLPVDELIAIGIKKALKNIG